jgi:hypothetical protein
MLKSERSLGLVDEEQGLPQQRKQHIHLHDSLDLRVIEPTADT